MNSSSFFRHKASLDYLAPGVDHPVHLTNSSAADVVSAASSGSRSPSGDQSLRNVMQSEVAYKPSKVGGISLVTPASVTLDGTVTAASYNANSGRLALKADDGRVWQLPPMDAELVRIAYDSVYRLGSPPELSIGTSPDTDLQDASRSGAWNVHYIGAIVGTRLGAVMLKADELLGDLAYGGSDALERLGLSKLGLHTLPETFPDRYAEPGHVEGDCTSSCRVFLVASSIPLAERAAGQLEFGPLEFDVRLDPDSPAEEDFARSLISHWGEIVAAPAGKSFRDLSEAARVVAVFIWLHDHFVTVDSSISSLKSPRNFFTPTEVPVRPPVTREALRPRLPLTVYSHEGIGRIVYAPGNVTRVAYSGDQ